MGLEFTFNPRDVLISDLCEFKDNLVYISSAKMVRIGGEGTKIDNETKAVLLSSFYLFVLFWEHTHGKVIASVMIEWNVEKLKLNEKKSFFFMMTQYLLVKELQVDEDFATFR